MLTISLVFCSGGCRSARRPSCDRAATPARKQSFCRVAVQTARNILASTN